MALGAPSSPRAEDFSKALDTSSQVSPPAVMPNDVESTDQTLEEICAPSTLPTKAPGPHTDALNDNVVQLQKEVNGALGCLLVTRSSLDAHQRK